MSDKNNNLEPSNPEDSEDFFRYINIQFLIHELKGPLGVIEANTRMLLDGQKDFGSLSKSQQKIINRSLRSTVKLRDIIHTLLEVGSSQTGNIRPQQFKVVECTAEILFDALETMVNKELPKNVTEQKEYLATQGLFLTFAPEMHEVSLYQDKTKFIHILSNMVRNGLQHRKSRITVSLKVKESDLLITVEDDGPGIGPDEYEILFKRYAQAQSQPGMKRKGHGLGLASARILTRSLGGDIAVDRQYNEGARFILNLPVTYGNK